MAQAFPYTYISCPCSSTSRQTLSTKRTSRDVEFDGELEDKEKTFNPRDPRSSFSLFPPEHLLYCEECHDIKCPRCVTEEIICSYCPTCLFEVPSSSVKQDYNRCARQCFSCPICFSQLIITSTGERNEGPFMLSCNYCMWSSLDCGIKFDKPQGLRSQLDSTSTGGKPRPSYREPVNFHNAIKNASSNHRPRPTLPEKVAEEPEAPDQQSGRSLLTDPHGRFEALKLFYKNQLADSSENSGLSGALLDGSFSSPSSLSRIMSMYAGTNNSFAKKAKQPPQPMREALTLGEGLMISDFKETLISDRVDYDEAPTLEQLKFQHPSPIGNPAAKHVSELRPMPNLLRTKRSKRCAACRHILVKPEVKIQSTRYRIKLVALNYIPLVSLKPVPAPDGLRAAGPDGQDVVLDGGKPSQWILTLRNPLFESVNVSLGSPSVTPGKHGHRVTLLCPEFTIGKNGDVFEDTLSGGQTRDISGPRGGEQIAGKVYESGRNWTSTVIEIIPALTMPTAIADDEQTGTELDEDQDEDENIIEVPIRVNLDWTVAEDEIEKPRTKSDRALGEDSGGPNGHPPDDGKRELAYWMVLGIGRVQTHMSTASATAPRHHQ